MSDLLKHIVVADTLGSMASYSQRSWMNNLASAFSLGLLSHAAMDLAEPDFTVNWFNYVALRDASPFLLFQFGGIYLVLRLMITRTRYAPRARILRFMAIIGAVIPDVIDGIYSILNPRAWYAGELLFPWHRLRWQVNVMSMWGTMAITSVLLLLRYLSLPFYNFLRPRPFIARRLEGMKALLGL